MDKSYEFASQITYKDPTQTNKIFQTFMNAHWHIAMNHLGEDGAHVHYLAALPQFDLTTSIYWKRDTLIEIDSLNLIEEIRGNMSYHHHLCQEFANFEHTRYNPDEWNWAFTISGSRVCILDNSNERYQSDPNYDSFISPLAEYLNHSFDPNVVLTLAKSKTIFSELSQADQALYQLKDFTGTEKIPILQ